MGKAISTAFGAKVEEFTPTFKMPAGWVVEFVREEQNIEAPPLEVGANASTRHGGDRWD